MLEAGNPINRLKLKAWRAERSLSENIQFAIGRNRSLQGRVPENMPRLVRQPGQPVPLTIFPQAPFDAMNRDLSFTIADMIYDNAQFGVLSALNTDLIRPVDVAVSWTDEEVRLMAAIIGSRYQKFPLLRRFDRRSPLEIIESGGFFPNPDSPAGFLHTHINPRSRGTAQFVSLTENFGHVGGNILNSSTHYQYFVRNVRGVRNHLAGIPSEFEVTATKVPLSQFTWVREPGDPTLRHIRSYMKR
jgi:hypothetical protein